MTAPELAELTTNRFNCAVCGESFLSRNKLFAHLELQGHHFLNEDLDARVSAEPSKSFQRTNADLYAYYQLQYGARSQELWDQTYARFQEELPTCIRLTLRTAALGPPVAEGTTEALLRHFGLLFNPASYHTHHRKTGRTESVGEQRGSCSLWNLASNGSGPCLEAAHSLGLLQRQEQNSALPPLLLGVCESDLVLDMCAAPGSKTLQLLDLMLADAAPGMLPSGLLVANDVNRERASLMAKRTRRQVRPCLLITNSDARVYPTLRKRKGFKLRFDRVLCDVPCSGDGTLRKDRAQRGGRRSPWSTWSVKAGLSLHVSQAKCLKRGLQHLRPGGRLVYSTCSLNPIEDEAVVACALGEGLARLVPLPNDLDRVPGLVDWRVPDPKFSAEKPLLYGSFDEAKAAYGDQRCPLLRTMFPPDSASIVEQLNHCGRILPVHGDGGGFFVALFERLSSERTCCIDERITPEQICRMHGVEQIIEEDRMEEEEEEEENKEMPEPKKGNPPSSAEEAAQQEQHQTSGPVEDPTDPALQVDVAPPLSLASSGAKEEKGVVSDLKSLFRLAPDETVAVLTEEFGLGNVRCSNGAGKESAVAEGCFPVEWLRVRGDSLVLVSPKMAKIWCSAKGLQVMEAGHYIASGVRQAPQGPLASWRVYPEAAGVLGCWARRRIVSVAHVALLELLVATVGKDVGVPYAQLLKAASLPEDGQPPQQGPLLLAIPHPESPLCVNSATLGYILGKIDAEGLVTLLEDSLMAARRWVELLSRDGRDELDHTFRSAVRDEECL